MTCRVDLHVHSKYSDRPSEWFLRRIGAPECFVEPHHIYHFALQRGMKFVTISDHNCIDGAMEIADLPGTFISNETTVYFPEDGCKIHCLVTGITPEQFTIIQEVRENIYDFRRYLLEEDIIYSVAHPLFRVNNRLTIEHVEKLLLMFNRFEGLNGARDPRASDLVNAIFRNLTPEIIEQLAARHDIEPIGPTPWAKTFTGGSDDHSGVYISSAYTATPDAETVEEFLAHLRRGDHEMGGESGTSLQMAHSFYHIAYQYYQDKFAGASGKNNIVADMFKKLLASEPPKPKARGVKGWVRGGMVKVVQSRRKRRLGEVERVLVDEFTRLFQEADHRAAGDVVSPVGDRRTFHLACRISHLLTYTFANTFVKYARDGRMIESLQTIASLGPVALSIAPYLTAFSTQHKDERFLQAVANQFERGCDMKVKSDRRAWLTDTLVDVNGVSRTIRTLGQIAKQQGRPLNVVTSLQNPPRLDLELKNFEPIGTFPLPEYESQEIAFPPFLEVIEYLERNRFGEVILSTPGPMGLVGLLAARFLRLRTAAIYHTDFPQYVRQLTGDLNLESMTWQYMQWFYNQADVIFAPSEYYRRYLIENGFDPAKLHVLQRGVHLDQFNTEKRQPGFYQRFGLGGAPKFVYVGRVSREKNVDALIDAFVRIRERGIRAELAIVGDGPLLAELKRKRRRSDIAFTGFLEGDDLAAAYASADVMVFPSTTDTFGNAVLEAQACGIPAIVSDRGGPQEIVRSHESGIVVDLTEPDALADAMAELISNDDKRNVMGAAALVNAQDRSWDSVFESFWQLTAPEETPDVLDNFHRIRPMDSARKAVELAGSMS